LLAVHWSHVDDVFKQAGELAGRILITCSLPMNANNTELIIGCASSGAEELARKVRSSRVVSAFGTVPSEVFVDVFEARDKPARPSLVYCGDDRSAKDVVASLIRDVGFDPVDAGPLQIARYLEPFALLMGQLAYEGEGSAGPRAAYRVEWLGKRARH
jgi:hypothetical protein